MTSCLSIKVVARAALRLAPAVLGLLLLSGCENEYPAELQYALRTDPIVAEPKPSDTSPITLDGPGEFDKAGERLPSLSK